MCAASLHLSQPGSQAHLASPSRIVEIPATRAGEAVSMAIMKISSTGRARLHSPPACRSDPESRNWTRQTLYNGYPHPSAWPSISAEEQEHLFERFFRGEAALQSKAPGSGLGLAICHEIVRLHGGQMAVESRPGLGSTFTAWLPAAGATGAGTNDLP